jgi:DNA-binding transcriptional ArsR family regulator
MVMTSRAPGRRQKGRFMALHRDVSPDECRQCRRVYEALVEHHKADPETWLTTEALGARLGLQKRAVQNHLAHLVARARLDVDRRTPLGASVGRPPLRGAQEWAASVQAPDPTCEKCLMAYAGFGWEGQVSMEDLAEAAGIALRTAQRHRPHLRAANLLRVRPSSIPAGHSGYRRRLPDRFELLSQMAAPRLEGEEREEARRRAERVLYAIRWFSDASEEERAMSAQEVAWLLYLGWPEDALLREVDYREARDVRHPSAYLHALLRRLPREYIIPARLVFLGEASPRVAECAECRGPVRTARPGRVLCGGADCLVSLPESEQYATVVKIA